METNMMKKCPKCSKSQPSWVLLCDCGYDMEFHKEKSNQEDSCKDSPKKVESIHFTCSECLIKIKISFPLKGRFFICSNCKTNYCIVSELDQINVIVIEKIPSKASDQPKNKLKKEVLQAFQAFNLDENANPQEVKKRYLDMMKKYHPDNVSHLGEEFQKMADEKTKSLNHFYEVLNSFFRNDTDSSKMD